MLGCSPGTVAWRIHEARNQLRAALEGVMSDEVDPSDVYQLALRARLS